MSVPMGNRPCCFHLRTRGDFLARSRWDRGELASFLHRCRREMEEANLGDDGRDRMEDISGRENHHGGAAPTRWYVVHVRIHLTPTCPTLDL